MKQADVAIDVEARFEVTVDNDLRDDVRKLGKSLRTDLDKGELEEELMADEGAINEFLQRVEGLVDASKKLLDAVDNASVSVKVTKV